MVPQEVEGEMRGLAADAAHALDCARRTARSLADPALDFERGPIGPLAAEPVRCPEEAEAILTLARLAQCPIITYEPGYTGRSHIDEAFQREGLRADVKKRYGARFGFTQRGEMIPNDDSYCELDPERKDQWGIPVLRFDYRFGDNEFKMAKDMADTVEEMLRAAKAEDIEIVPNRGPVVATVSAQEAAWLYEVRHGQIWRLFTPAFLHFGVAHLGFAGAPGLPCFGADVYNGP